MATAERIPLAKTTALWQALKADGAVVKLRDVEQDNEWVAAVIDVRTHKRQVYLIVREEGSLGAALEKIPASRLLMAFTDRNKVPHTCGISHFHLKGEEVWLALPERIERHQRRRIFRLEAPAGSRLELEIEGISYKLLLLNVSINGALGVLPVARSDEDPPPLGSTGLTISDAQLVFPAKEGFRRVPIAGCTIRRHGIHRPSGKIQYAFEFTELDESSVRLLTEMIYEYQRTYLRRRRLSR